MSQTTDLPVLQRGVTTTQLQEPGVHRQRLGLNSVAVGGYGISQLGPDKPAQRPVGAGTGAGEGGGVAGSGGRAGPHSERMKGAWPARLEGGVASETGRGRLWTCRAVSTRL